MSVYRFEGLPSGLSCSYIRGKETSTEAQSSRGWDQHIRRLHEGARHACKVCVKVFLVFFRRNGAPEFENRVRLLPLSLKTVSFIEKWFPY